MVTNEEKDYSLMWNAKWFYLSILSFALATFGLVQQYIVADVWFQWEQFWHHEPLIAVALIAGITLSIVYLEEYRQAKRRNRQNSKGSDQSVRKL